MLWAYLAWWYSTCRRGGIQQQQPAICRIVAFFAVFCDCVTWVVGVSARVCHACCAAAGSRLPGGGWTGQPGSNIGCQVARVGSSWCCLAWQPNDSPGQMPCEQVETLHIDCVLVESTQVGFGCTMLGIALLIAGGMPDRCVLAQAWCFVCLNFRQVWMPHTSSRCVWLMTAISSLLT